LFWVGTGKANRRHEFDQMHGPVWTWPLHSWKFSNDM
jgi:hypothetical protein